MGPFLRTEWNYDMNEASDASGLKCEDPSLAQQSFKDECDINVIVERFHLTGTIPQLDQLPSYENYEGIFDFQDAMNAVRQAQEQFMTLPAGLRARFHNEPQEFLDFCADENNRDEARKLGLLKPEEPATVLSATPTKGEPNGSEPAKATAPAPEGKTGSS